ncbi:MAG: hypothetical protein ACKVJS_02990 [Flavobacteriales bacterium]|jgi:hypothetical protein|tara:strand:- start:675 stop:1499 length:825 start_codon:yes stop_codon:yes gene_type:complete
MKKIILLALVFFLQEIRSQKIQKDYPLSNIIEETSGLEIIDDVFITHNDSGGEASLYYLSKEGEIIKTREVKHAVNIDWEDLTRDDKYIYISDIGNNYNNRKDLKIYKLPIDESSEEKTKIISFNYPEQNSFKINRNTIYDAEGLISIDDKLIIFTKNRAKKITELYLIPKDPGNYDAKKIGTLKVNSIITAADYNKDLRLLALTSTIDFNEYYLITVPDFSLKGKKDYKINMVEIPIGKTQVEAIKIIDSKSFWISSEDESNSDHARLMKMSL